MVLYSISSSNHNIWRKRNRVGGRAGERAGLGRSLPSGAGLCRGKLLPAVGEEGHSRGVNFLPAPPPWLRSWGLLGEWVWGVHCLAHYLTESPHLESFSLTLCRSWSWVAKAGVHSPPPLSLPLLPLPARLECRGFAASAL